MTLNVAPGLNAFGYYKFCLCEDLMPIILEKSRFTTHKKGGWREEGSTDQQTFSCSNSTIEII